MIDPELLAEAARLIRDGKLVAFPTETVYGLGANVLNEAAVDGIFAAKGRPATSPLIVHVASVEMARSVVAAWPQAADKLAARFWPGPLTLVLPKRKEIPLRVTAGLETVGVRVPAHPIALALIRAAQVPIAAPSANPFMSLSPTTAEHVRQSLGEKVALVIDGGPSAIGLESTVLSLASNEPVLLRPGMIPASEIEAVIGTIQIANQALSQNVSHAAPGMHARHYSPKTPLMLGRIPHQGRGVYLYLTSSAAGIASRQMPGQPEEYAAVLYSTLHELDGQGWEWIAVEPPPDSPEWAAILDRLRRASATS